VNTLLLFCFAVLANVGTNAAMQACFYRRACQLRALVLLCVALLHCYYILESNCTSVFYRGWWIKLCYPLQSCVVLTVLRSVASSFQ
jgi:hypothetical protein